MHEPTDNVSRLERIAKTMEAGHWLSSAKVVREAADEIERLLAERDEARLQTARILNEIDCRIEHGADSNGHLEAIYNLFKENTDV